jgi:hypothetical protein
MRIKKWVIPTVIILWVACGISLLLINRWEQKQLEAIRGENKAPRGEQQFVGYQTTKTEQTFAYEPKKAVKIDVCNNSSTKTYMDYRAITNKKSKQYQFIQANMTADERGYLIDNEGYIGVALGSYFGNIGTRYRFILEGGIELKIIKVEAKADKHTNNGCEQKWDKSVIEFVIDTQKAKNYYGIASNGYINSGNFNKVFSGKIIEIEKVVN